MIAKKAKSEAADPTETPPDSTVDLVAAQQNFYELFGFASGPVYDVYPTKSILKRKLGMLFDEKKISEKIGDLIWEQRCHVGDSSAIGLRMSQIFVMCAYDMYNMRQKFSSPLTMRSNKYTLHPIFRVQKCTRVSKDARDCCAVFIDELGRVYSDWDDFTENNRFDDCVMLAPKHGIYMGDPRRKEVLLEVYLRKSGVTEAVDLVSTLGGIGAAGVGVAAAIPAIAVAPAVIAVASGVGVACAAYTGARSIYTLYDRKQHKQSTGLEDRESRNAWLNIGSSTLLAGSSGAAVGLSKMMQNGANVSRFAQMTVKGTQIGTFGMQTLLCIDGTYSIGQKLLDGEDISFLELAQLSSALFLWTHSARNLGLAEKFMKISGEKNTMATKRFLVTAQKTMMGTLSDHRKMINLAQEINGSVIVRELKASFSFSTSKNDNQMEHHYDLSEGVDASVKIEYCRLFDTRIEVIVHKLDRHYKHSKLRALKQYLIKFMCWMQNLTLRGIYYLVEYAHRMVSSFVRELLDEYEFAKEYLTEFIVEIVRMIFMEIKKIVESKMRAMSENDYMTGLYFEDRRVREENENIRENVLNNIRASMATNTEPLIEDDNEPSTDGISNDRKVASLIEDRVDDAMEILKHFNIEGRESQLRETITGIVKALKPQLSEVFFNIAFIIVRKYVCISKQRLGRPIPVNSMLDNLFCILDMTYENKIETILERFHDEMYSKLDGEFSEMCQPIIEPKYLKVCEKCSGVKHTKKE